jgi:hypothetical protein
MYDFRELSIKIFILLVVYSIIYYYPKLNKYSDETKFNYYRSFMCLAFTIIGLHILINHFSNGFSHPFSYHHYDMDEIHYIFMAYLIIDIIKLLASKSTRYDLYGHHIISILTILSGIFTNKFGYLHCIVLICESISIVTGIDSIAIEDNDNYLSYLCKKFRKNIINYIRLPIWLSIFIFSLKYLNRGPKMLIYPGLIFPFIMIFLDRYWEKKCDKVINKYE